MKPFRILEHLEDFEQIFFSELERKHAQLADMEKKVEIYEALIVRSSSVQLTQSLQSLTREFERHDGKEYIRISRIYEG